MPEHKQESGRRTRRYFDEQFKRHAVELTMQGVKTVTAVAAELGLTRSVLERWKARYAPPPGGGGGGAPTRGIAQLEDENRRLRDELARMQQREEVLKKSLGILSEPPVRGMPGSKR